MNNQANPLSGGMINNSNQGVNSNLNAKIDNSYNSTNMPVTIINGNNSYNNSSISNSNTFYINNKNIVITLGNELSPSAKPPLVPNA